MTEEEDKQEDDGIEVVVMEEETKEMTKSEMGTALRDKFFGFLSTKGELNEVLAGYFLRIFESFMNSKQ